MNLQHLYYFSRYFINCSQLRYLNIISTYVHLIMIHGNKWEIKDKVKQLIGKKTSDHISLLPLSQ